MPEEAIVQYNPNIMSSDLQSLKEIEPYVVAALQSNHIFGQSQWITKHDSQNRKFFVLERANKAGQMLTYCLPQEISSLTTESIQRHIFRERRDYIESLSRSPLFFEQMSSEQRLNIASSRRDTTIVVPRQAVNIGNLSTHTRSPTRPTHVEIPPTPVALEDKNIATLLVHSGNTLADSWTRLILMVYRNNGRIFLREIDQGNIEAFVEFN